METVTVIAVKVTAYCGVFKAHTCSRFKREECERMRGYRKYQRKFIVYLLCIVCMVSDFVEVISMDSAVRAVQRFSHHNECCSPKIICLGD